MRKAMIYGAGLIALYLIVKNGSGFAQAAKGLGDAGGTAVTKLQGR